MLSGTESERSFSGRDSHRPLLRQSVVPGKPVMKIAAINGKPGANHRYLGMSRECEFYLFISFYANFINLPLLTRSYN